MKTREQLERSLENIDGFKALFKGLFGGGKAKKSFEIYSAVQQKGVFDLIALREDTHDDHYYAIFAFSCKGAIACEIIDTLKERAKAVPLGTIRYESLSYGKLEPWRGGENSFANENKSITTLSDEWPDIFVFPVAEGKPENLDCPYIIYAHKDGKDYIYPIPAKKLI